MSYIIVSSAETEKILYASGNLKVVDNFIYVNKEMFGECELTVYEIKEIKKINIEVLTKEI